MSSSMADLKKYRIPLEEVVRATNNFSSETKIGDGGFGSVHKGQLSEQWQNRTVAIKRLNPDDYQGSKEFHNELAMVSGFNHPNIINFIGFCDDNNQMIIVYDFAFNGSLDHHLQDSEKRRRLTWEQRLFLCLGAAKGLEYLHSGLGEHNRVIHRDVKSANILLDDKLEAKICDFGLSRFGARNQDNTQLLTRIAGTRFYMDPVYAERSRLTKESDVYSFGVVMFEISSGALVYHRRCFGLDVKPQYLIDLIRSYYDDDEKDSGPDKLIDPFIRGHIDMRSFHMFNNMAHECLNLKLKERPKMDHIIRTINQALDIQLGHETFSSISTQSLESFLIPLEEIKLATQCFSDEKRVGRSDEKRVGRTEFGEVYRAQLSQRWENRTLSIKRLYKRFYQEKDEFYKELQMFCFFQHQNILHFVGYCDEADEGIIVHDHPFNGSLGYFYDDNGRNNLSWTQRLKICIGVARGLRYLQLHLGEDSEVLHGKINSRNIMLDENMEAKISFSGLLKQGRPLGIQFDRYPNELPEKSDIFSFGLILYEMLSGSPACCIGWGDDGREKLTGFVMEYQSGGNRLHHDRSIEIDHHCSNVVNEIAYQCIVTDASWIKYGKHVVFGKKNPEARPSIDRVIERLEYAASLQGLKV